jgi:hypothetical protein
VPLIPQAIAAFRAKAEIAAQPSWYGRAGIGLRATPQNHRNFAASFRLSLRLPHNSLQSCNTLAQILEFACLGLELRAVNES